MATRKNSKKTTTKKSATKKKSRARKAPTKPTAAKTSTNKKSTSEAAMRSAANKASAKKTAKPPTTKAKSSAANTKKPSGLDLAAKVLAASKEPLNAKTIAERAITAGWKTSGKTPHATLYAAMIREMRDKGKAARFEKVDRGLFRAAKGGA